MNECGHLSIRNIMLYLKFRTKETTTREVQLLGEYLKPHTAREMNKEILVLLAKELDPERRDVRYRAPFCQLRTRNASETEEEGLLIDGAPPAVANKHRTRSSRSAEYVDLEH